MTIKTQQHDGESATDDTTTESFVVLTPTDGNSVTDDGATWSYVVVRAGEEQRESAPSSANLGSTGAQASRPKAATQPTSSLKLLSPDQSLAVAEYVSAFTSPSFSRTNDSVPEIDIKALMLGDYDVGMSCIATRVSVSYFRLATTREITKK